MFGAESDESAAAPSAEPQQTSGAQTEAARVSVSQTATTSSPAAGAAPQQDGSSNPKAEGSTLFVKNLSFGTTETQLREALARVAHDILSVHIPQVLAAAAAPEKSSALKGAKKEPPKQQLRSAGYAFVELGGRESAALLVKEAQHMQLDGHELELQVARARPHTHKAQSPTKGEAKAAPASTKILVRNVPFQAKKREISQLFRCRYRLVLMRVLRFFFFL